VTRSTIAAFLLAGLASVAACACTSAPPQDPVAAAPAVPAAHFWFAAYPDFMVEFDPVTDTVVKKIQLQNGMSWGVTLLFDRQHFAVITDTQRKVEIVDCKQGAVASVHDFSEEGVIVRVRSISELPGGTQWYVETDRVKKLVDRYEFQPAQTLLYDVGERKIVRKMRRMPQILSRGARISPDGLSWHVFDRDGNLQIVDPKTLKETGKIDLATPQFAGQGRISLRRTDLLFGRDPNKYRMLCSYSDPVQHSRSSWGYVDIDLQQKKITDMVEWGQGPSGFGSYLSRDAKLTVSSNGGWGGGSDRKTTIQLYDLENGKKLREFQTEFRPRQSLAAIAPDGSKVYVGGAGSDFQVFDAVTFQLLRVVEFDGEIQGQVYMLDV
jgi:hypothetical protein